MIFDRENPGRTPVRPLIVLVLALHAAACAQAVDGDAKYALDQCVRVAIIDAVTKDPIVGAEDLAIDREGDRLFISAYSRRNVERAVRKKAPEIPQGGVYVISLGDLSLKNDHAIMATPIATPDEFAGGLHPHGIFYDRSAKEVSFINRSYHYANNKWRMTPHIERVGANGEAYVGAPRIAPCSANDLIAGAEGALVSYDHAACNWRAGIEDLFYLKRSGIADHNGSSLYDQASFANGMVRTQTGAVVIAATREKTLVVLKQSASGLLEPVKRIAVPGGPDNLTVSTDGGVVAAVHPSLFKIGLHRRMGLGLSPSRIVKVDLETGAVELLFEDSVGKLFSAATVAAEWDNAVVAGSVTDDGLLVCRNAS